MRTLTFFFRPGKEKEPLRSRREERRGGGNLAALNSSDCIGWWPGAMKSKTLSYAHRNTNYYAFESEMAWARIFYS
jgi:hypothetical protein